jgi:hypothetical protein
MQSLPRAYACGACGAHPRYVSCAAFRSLACCAGSAGVADLFCFVRADLPYHPQVRKVVYLHQAQRQTVSMTDRSFPGGVVWRLHRCRLQMVLAQPQQQAHCRSCFGEALAPLLVEVHQVWEDAACCLSASTARLPKAQ